MRICCCSDIHGNGYAFQAFLEDVKKYKADRIVFIGDVFGYYYDAEHILTTMRTTDKFVCLLGNHDQMFLDLADGKVSQELLTAKYGMSYDHIVSQVCECNICFLRQLKPVYQMTADSVKLAFFHGGPSDPLNMRIYPDTPLTGLQMMQEWDVIFCGHTHHKMMRSHGGTLLVNPGSAGQQRDGKGTSYVIYDTKDRMLEWHVFTYDVDALIRKIEERETDTCMRKRLVEVLLREGHAQI